MLHLPLPHTFFFFFFPTLSSPSPPPPDTKEVRGKKGLTWLALLGHGVVPSGLSRCWQWFAVGCACVRGVSWPFPYREPVNSLPWRQILGVPWSSPCPRISHLSRWSLRTQGIEGFCGIQNQSSGKFTPLTPSGHFLLLFAVIRFLWRLSSYCLKLVDCWRPGCVQETQGKIPGGSPTSL